MSNAMRMVGALSAMVSVPDYPLDYLYERNFKVDKKMQRAKRLERKKERQRKKEARR